MPEISGSRYDNSRRNLCPKTCAHGSKPSSLGSPASPTPRLRSVSAVALARALARYVDCAQQVRPNARYTSSTSDAKTSFTPIRTLVGERAIYSLHGSAELNGLDPEIYLQGVLECIADHSISKTRFARPVICTSEIVSVAQK